MTMNFPRDRSQYVLSSTPGYPTPDGATVHRAKHVNPATGEEVDVRIKIIDVNKLIEDTYTFTSQLCKARTTDHAAIVKVHCSFVTDNRLWVVMSPHGVPIRSVMWSDFPHGLPEKAICFILKETLNVINYMHAEKNLVCKNIGAGCVCLDGDYVVKIAMSSITYEDRANGLMNSGFIRDYGLDESKETDVLMFGFLALELFYGRIPTSEEFNLLVANEFGLKKEKEKANKFWVFSCFRGGTRRVPPEALAKVMAACLLRQPEARPKAAELMEYKLFQTKFSGNQSLKKLMKR